MKPTGKNQHSPEHANLEGMDLAVFRTRVCEQHRNGKCINSDRCPHSHCQTWQRRNPNEYTYLSKLCPEIEFVKRESKMTLLRRCSRGRGCSFAHSKEEELYHPSVYKTKMCNSHPYCTRYFCPFAHCQDEIRVPTMTIAINVGCTGGEEAVSTSKVPFSAPSKRWNEVVGNNSSSTLCQQQPVGTQSMQYHQRLSLTSVIAAAAAAANNTDQQAQQQQKRLPAVRCPGSPLSSSSTTASSVPSPVLACLSPVTSKTCRYDLVTDSSDSAIGKEGLLAHDEQQQSETTEKKNQLALTTREQQSELHHPKTMEQELVPHTHQQQHRHHHLLVQKSALSSVVEGKWQQQYQKSSLAPMQHKSSPFLLASDSISSSNYQYHHPSDSMLQNSNDMFMSNCSNNHRSNEDEDDDDGGNDCVAAAAANSILSDVTSPSGNRGYGVNEQELKSAIFTVAGLFNGDRSDPFFQEIFSALQRSEQKHEDCNVATSFGGHNNRDCIDSLTSTQAFDSFRCGSGAHSDSSAREDRALQQLIASLATGYDGQQAHPASHCNKQRSTSSIIGPQTDNYCGNCSTSMCSTAASTSPLWSGDISASSSCSSFSSSMANWDSRFSNGNPHRSSATSLAATSIGVAPVGLGFDSQPAASSSMRPFTTRPGAYEWKSVLADTVAAGERERADTVNTISSPVPNVRLVNRLPSGNFDMQGLHSHSAERNSDMNYSTYGDARNSTPWQINTSPSSPSCSSAISFDTVHNRLPCNFHHGYSTSNLSDEIPSDNPHYFNNQLIAAALDNKNLFAAWLQDQTDSTDLKHSAATTDFLDATQSLVDQGGSSCFLSTQRSRLIQQSSQLEVESTMRASTLGVQSPTHHHHHQQDERQQQLKDLNDSFLNSSGSYCLGKDWRNRDHLEPSCLQAPSNGNYRHHTWVPAYPSSRHLRQKPTASTTITNSGSSFFAAAIIAQEQRNRSRSNLESPPPPPSNVDTDGGNNGTYGVNPYAMPNMSWNMMMNKNNNNNNNNSENKPLYASTLPNGGVAVAQAVADFYWDSSRALEAATSLTSEQAATS